MTNLWKNLNSISISKTFRPRGFAHAEETRMNSEIQFALFVLVGIVFYLALRVMFSRKDEGKLGDYAPLDPRIERRFDHAFDGSAGAAREVELAPVSETLGRVRVTQFNFE